MAVWHRWILDHFLTLILIFEFQCNPKYYQSICKTERQKIQNGKLLGFFRIKTNTISILIWHWWPCVFRNFFVWFVIFITVRDLLQKFLLLYCYKFMKKNVSHCSSVIVTIDMFVLVVLLKPLMMILVFLFVYSRYCAVLAYFCLCHP